MHRKLTPSSTLDTLKKEAKNRLRAVLANDSTALLRLHQAYPNCPNPPCLRDIQHVIALEHGLAGWQALRDRLSSGSVAPADVLPARRPYRVDSADRSISAGRSFDPEDWDRLLSEARNQRIPTIHANGHMTDSVLEQLSHLDHVTTLHLGNSVKVTDEGLKHLSHMPQLRSLQLGGVVTDGGLGVLRHLPELRYFEMCWQTGVSDIGAANLRFCKQLESVNLMSTTTGDGAIVALAGMGELRNLRTGKLVTDDGLLGLHNLPVFKSWAGGVPRLALMEASAEPNQLVIDGVFTDAGVSRLTGLDGLYALSFFWHCPNITPKCLSTLSEIPKLGYLGCEGKLCNEEAMQYIGRLPHLRMLMAQGAVANDSGFRHLSQSETLEYIWGRECPNLTGAGFAALSRIPTLQGIAVSCKHVDDSALSTLPEYPLLREIMPMDVPDEGFRHIGRCPKMEALWCMYCRDTTDRATEHLEGMNCLKSYYAGASQITDRSLEVLSRITTLQTLSFWKCAGITDEGLRLIAGLPRLSKVTLDGLERVTEAGLALFPATVHVHYAD